MSTPSPFRIEQAMSAALAFREQILAELSGEETDYDLLLDCIDGETDAIDILRRVIRGALEAETIEKAVAERIKTLTERKQRFGARGDALRGLAFRMLDALGLPKLADPEFTASIGQPRQKVIVTDVDALPEAFVRVTRAPDMATISAAVKAGQVPAGVEISNSAPSLTIRVK